jgi:hypothetical protein
MNLACISSGQLLQKSDKSLYGKSAWAGHFLGAVLSHLPTPPLLILRATRNAVDQAPLLAVLATIIDALGQPSPTTTMGMMRNASSSMSLMGSGLVQADAGLPGTGDRWRGLGRNTGNGNTAA